MLKLILKLDYKSGKLWKQLEISIFRKTYRELFNEFGK